MLFRSSASGVVTTPGPAVVVVDATGTVALVSGRCNWGGGVAVGTTTPALRDAHAVTAELTAVLWLAVIVITVVLITFVLVTVVLVTVILVTVILVLVAVVVLVTVVVLVIASRAGAGLATGPVVGFVSFSRLDLHGFGVGGDHVSTTEAGGFGNGCGGGRGRCGGFGALGGGGATVMPLSSRIAAFLNKNDVK